MLTYNVTLTLDREAQGNLKEILKLFLRIMEERFDNPPTLDQISIDTEEKASALILAALEKLADIASAYMNDPNDYTDLIETILGKNPDDSDEPLGEPCTSTMRVFRPRGV